MNTDKMQIVNGQGQTIEADILLSYKNSKNDKNYVLYTFHEYDEQAMETIHASILVKEGEDYKLEKIPDDEWLEVKDVMREIIKNEEGR